MLSASDTSPIDVRFWGIKLRAPWDGLQREEWDFETGHAITLRLGRVLGADIMSTVTALVPAFMTGDPGDRLAMAQVVLMNQATALREAFLRAMSDDVSILYQCLGGVSALQTTAAKPEGMPVLDPGNGNKVIMSIFASRGDVYKTALAFLMETYLPLDGGQVTSRESLRASMPLQNPFAAHLKTAFPTLSIPGPSDSKPPRR